MKKRDLLSRGAVLRALAFLFAVFFFSFVPAAIPAGAEEAPILEYVKSACLYNVESDSVLFELNPKEAVFPTSTVKIMTGIVAIENLPDLKQQVTVTSQMLETVRGNSIGFIEGETITVGDALYCLLMNNANDAALILAYTVAGNETAFVKMMNDKAEQLSAWNTTYTNCTGMHDEAAVTTAADTLEIAKYAYSLDRFVEMTGTAHYVIDSTNVSEARDV